MTAIDPDINRDVVDPDEGPSTGTGHPVADRPHMSSKIEAAAAVLCEARNPLLFCHQSPDGDTVGAAVALALALRCLGNDPAVVCSDSLPRSLSFVPHSAMILSSAPENPDLLVTIDSSDIGMLGELSQELARLRQGRTLVNIDHHASDTGYGDINVVDPSAASTAELVTDLIDLLGIPLDSEMATALLTGIINDTHSFQNANTSPRALRTAARLVAAGADPVLITNQLLLRRRPQAALLWAQTLATLRIDDDGRVASAFATTTMLESCDAETSDLDGVVEFLRHIDGVDLAFLLKGTSLDSYKASVRTTECVDAVALTAPFGGGGHLRAAGCDLIGTPDSARAALLARYHELVGPVADPA